MKELLNKLAYCNKAIKIFSLSLSKTEFYKLKQEIIRHICNNQEKYNLVVTVKSIELNEYEHLFVLLNFKGEDLNIDLHQIYTPSFYKKMFDLSNVEFNKFEPAPINNSFSAFIAEEYLKDLNAFFISLQPTNTFIQKLKTILPDCTIIKKGKLKYHIYGIIDGQKVDVIVKKQKLKKHIDILKQYVKDAQIN